MFVPHACGGEFGEFNSNVWDMVVVNKNRAFWHGINVWIRIQQFVHDETGKFVLLPVGVPLI